MKVLMVSDHETSGGAAIAASRLASGLVDSGHDVLRLVHDASTEEDRPWASAAIAPPSRVLRGVRRVASRAESLVRGRATTRILEAAASYAPDVVNIHNIHSARWAGWDVEMIARLGEQWPTIWTLHDMWSFTGRCAYAHDCVQYLAGCTESCPTPTEYPALEPAVINDHWQSKRRLLEHLSDLVAVAPSVWLAEAASRGLWRDHRVEHIPYGLPLDVFAPMGRGEARAALGLRSGVPVVLLAAADLGSRRKNTAAALHALESVGRPLVALVMGGGAEVAVAGDVEVVALGHVADDRVKRLAYNAADIYLQPSLADNLPNVVQEALACGTPTVALPVGGIVDMVRPGVTGWLAASTAADDLATALGQALEGIQRGSDLRHECRSVAEAEYDLRQQANCYADLFDQLGEGRSS